MYPFRKPDNLPSSPHKDEPVEAVLIFHDCLDWGLEMQVVCDVILGRQQNKIGSSTPESFDQRVPIYVSNADIVYSSDHPFPRFTQGAFVEAFKALFEIYSGGQNLVIQTCGKPFKIQYDFARNLLANEANLLGKTPISHYYGVGDNPKSDIRGANAAGDNWTSVLVRTGEMHYHY
jgi:HAD superfamily hydrolase (TIGR01450 family)